MIIAISAAAGIALAVTLGITYFGKWEGRSLQLSEMASDPAEPGTGALKEPGQTGAAGRTGDREGTESVKPVESPMSPGPERQSGNVPSAAEAEMGRIADRVPGSVSGDRFGAVP